MAPQLRGYFTKQVDGFSLRGNTEITGNMSGLLTFTSSIEGGNTREECNARP